MVLLAACGALASGCGQVRHDAHEPKGLFTVQVLKARFPSRQAIAHPAALELEVRNAGARTMPNVAITLDSLSYVENYPDLAANKRPVWIVDEGPGAIPKRPVESEAVVPPGGGQTAYVNTWALGALPPGSSQTFIWRVTPVKAGMHTVNFAVAAGLDGKAHVQLPGGGVPRGRFTVQIAPLPLATQVNPDTGQVAPGAARVPQGPLPAAP